MQVKNDAVAKMRLKVEKAKHFRLKKWVKEVLYELVEADPELNIDIDWRDSDCLREILLEHEDIAVKVIGL